jgi:predicted CxxxxCH...CXXCH cytochrome family protein
VAAPGHIDEPPAEVVFGADASRGLTTPIYEVATKRCVDAYCHGATTTGGTNTAPVWGTPVTAEAPCDLCHGNPPPTDDHPAGTTACPTCHPDTVNPEGTINESTGAHIDGLIQSIFKK